MSEGEVEEKKKKEWLWPKIEGHASALELAKGGSLGGGIMIAGLVLAVALAYFTDNPAIFGAASSSEFLIYQGVQVVIASFLTWRVWTGKGLISAIILLLWITAEVLLKATAGQLNVGWAVMWFFAILSLVHSVRGHLALRGLRKSSEA
jgi:hypothetical protein